MRVEFVFAHCYHYRKCSRSRTVLTRIRWKHEIVLKYQMQWTNPSGHKLGGTLTIANFRQIQNILFDRFQLVCILLDSYERS